MLDQTFTTENFRRIYDRENRKGQNLEGKYFPALAGLTDQIRARTAQIRELRKTQGFTSSPPLQAQVEALQIERGELKRQKDEAIDHELEALAAQVRSDAFTVQLTQTPGPGDKDLYPAEDIAANFFVLKQLQQNLKALYGVKQAHRHHIVCQLRDTLDNPFSWVLVRTDIESFYENVDRSSLLSNIAADQLLSVSSKRNIRKILHSYGVLSGNPKGLPRGVGVSAYLAELFMRPVDTALRSLDGAIYYARYVDDIVIVFAPTRADDTTAYETRVRKVISDHGLTPNPAKTFAKVMGASHSAAFDYLGYRFVSSGGRCAVSVSAKKIARYKKRIELCFEDFERRVHLESKAARRLLVSRMRFLTGNTKLHNNKRHALTGIYYNNSAITSHESLAPLDAYKSYLTGNLAIPSLQQQLAQLSFVRGFQERTFHAFSPKALNRIVRVWQHEEA